MPFLERRISKHNGGNTMVTKQLNKKFNWGKTGSAFLMTALALMMIAFASFAFAQTDLTRPTVVLVSPANNEREVSINEPITVEFSENMNPSSINENTFTVMQRTTPDSGSYRATSIDGTVTYNNRKATFTPSEPLAPNQEFGNVYTVTLTTGMKDLAGNSISPNYMWSFVTGEDAFNTGASTSQLGQGGIIPSTPVAPTAPVSTQPAAPVATPTATESTFPWMWVLGALLLLLLIAAIFALTRDSKKSASHKTPAAHVDSNSNPFGDVHPVIAIEGIGPVYKEGLLSMGIKNTKQLWQADAATVARGINAPLSSVKSWQHMAELASVKDIGPQYAELLERSGVHSIDQLKKYDVDKLVKLVHKKQNSLDVNIQGNSLGHATVKNWIDEAKGHHFSGREEQTA